MDNSGALSLAGTGHRVGNTFKDEEAGVRVVGDTVQITIQGQLVRSHRPDTTGRRSSGPWRDRQSKESP